MKFSVKLLLAATGLVGMLAAQAQTLPTDAPAGSTVQCKDDSYASPDTKSGACRGHKGIKTWYGKAGAAAAPAAAASAALLAASSCSFSSSNVTSTSAT